MNYYIFPSVAIALNFGFQGFGGFCFVLFCFEIVL